ncbi:MAG: hypothetical protein LBQ98_00915, partial [Nitrososphaerota archaeon]|nr:hypothetical protein [Nitrososphaerota archaeon]
MVNNEVEFRNAINTAMGSTVIALGNDITLSSPLAISANKNITLTSNSATKIYKLIGAPEQSTIIVELSGVLLLNGIIITHVDDTPDTTGVLVNSGGTLSMLGGEISSNGESGVWNRGNFSLLGGKISRNSHAVGHNSNSHPGGGGVYNVGVFTMSGGEISSNSLRPSYYSGLGCGGVYNSGVFNMSGGLIANNIAPFGSGVSNEGNFTMFGGELLGNTEGGGVYNRGNFSMFRGKISHNIGGGVRNGGNFSLVGGEISGNRFGSSILFGGGVANECVFKMSGGMISDNRALGD